MSETVESVKEPTPRNAPPSGAAKQLLGRGTTLLLVLAILGSAGGISAYWLTHRPHATRRPPSGQAMLVDIQQVQPAEEVVVLRAMGTVVPAQSIGLASRVRGEIVQVSPKFVPGGRFGSGELMVKIDPKDFELSVRLQQAQVKNAAANVKQTASAVNQREADLTRAEAELVMEMGRQSAALGEYKLLGETVKPEDQALVLRAPQLKQARAACSAAEAAKQAAAATVEAAEASERASKVVLDQARLDLKRTELRAPFNAMVRSRSVDLGAHVSVGSPMASLVGTDEYWVEVSVPVDELKWIRIPELGYRLDSSTYKM